MYVLKDGRVIEQGYRSDLESTVSSPYNDHQGEFKKMMETQSETGGFLPKQDLATPTSSESLHAAFRRGEGLPDQTPGYLRPYSMALRPLTFGTWMFDVVADLTGSKVATTALDRNVTSDRDRDTRHLSQFIPPDKHTKMPDRRRPSTSYAPSVPDVPACPPSAYTVHEKRFSAAPATPTSATFTTHHRKPSLTDTDSDCGKSTMERSADATRKARGPRGGERTRWDGRGDVALSYIKVEKTPYSEDQPLDDSDGVRTQSFWSAIRSVYPSVPQKPLLFFGIVTCILSGAMTPVFSFLLSRLLFEVSIGAKNTSIINMFGGLVLGIAAVDGFFLGLKYSIMETCAMNWVTKTRKIALCRILMQDRKWFDRPAHASSKLVQVLVKDGDDARDLIAVVLGQLCVVAAMLCVGIIWALIRGWQLTLAGVAIAPVFALIMAFQSKLVAKCEFRNKRSREEVATSYFDVCLTFSIQGVDSNRKFILDHHQHPRHTLDGIRRRIQGPIRCFHR